MFDNNNENLANYEIEGNSHLLFIDGGVADYQSLVSDREDTTVILLNNSFDGVEQITAVLAKYQNLETIEIVAHGEVASLNLGNSQLNLTTLNHYAEDVRGWSDALRASGDILIHGCNVAAGATGLDFVAQLSELTNADIAASNDLTGNTQLGGDWQLEVTTGAIESQSALNADANYSFILATYNGNEYQLTSNATSWQQAQVEAEALGGNLVTINDAAEQQWLQDTFGVDERLWIGFNDQNSEGNFEWVSGSNASYTNWLPNQPDNFGQGENFVATNWKNTTDKAGKWNDVGGAANFRGIIEIGNDNPTDTEIFTNGGSEYRLTTSATSWQQAQTEAESLGGNLVTVNDIIEEQWLSDTFGNTERLWIGLNDNATEGQFEWASGENAPYRNWRNNQPDNFGAGEDFVAMNWKNGDVRWNDVGGAANFRGIIEIIRDPGEISLENNSFTVNETDGTVSVEVLRTGGSNGTVTVDYQTANSSAQAGTDYTAVAGTLTFAPGETSKTINVSIIDDNNVENNENFNLILDNVTGGANILEPRTASIEIIDNDFDNTPVTVTYNDDPSPNQSIPDNNGTGITRTFNVTDNLNITDINLGLSITHTWRSDLDITLQHPDGTIIDLTSDNGGNNDNLYVLFDDDSSLNITADSNSHNTPGYSNLRIPEQALSRFNGKSSLGTWTLRIVDDAEADIGSYNDSRLIITGTPGDSTPPPSTSDLLPDLTVIDASVTEGLRVDTTTQPGRALLRFTTEVANAGDGPLEIWADEVVGDTQDVFQRIYQDDGSSRDVAAGGFSYFAPHGHSHFDDFAVFNLRRVNPDGSVGEIVTTGDDKYSFCLINIRQPFPEITNNALIVDGRGGDSCGSIQGISVGYSDVYNSNLANQWIDVTNVPDGEYWLETIIDPLDRILETNDNNNVSRVRVTVDNPFV